ncbi:nose resistant to fluoxetine protein 6 [Drosophila nasuta]|uniref:nose resistant to fluoxetine protein 6 n=1 Tax=Drosophila nasuta TaxID=42062 RepID=UPI00295F281F|nr:nose resistant to fluoxetine protein 6 [Drosophila nasuta]XP_060657605.1 nose resistant to fluoxetine protein 6 [Drosophila nasuta]XP_060657606.1 nose resistant to fluoxetine protein 6 [Drosophila nasuta]
MNRLGCGKVLAAALLLLLLQLGNSQAEFNDSTLQLQRFRLNTLNATNVWSLPLPPLAAVPQQPVKEAGGHDAHLARSSIIYGLAEVANVSNVNAVCHAQLKHVQRGVLGKQPWAMKVLDASGSKSSGFVFGQNYWLGSRDACRAVQRPVGVTLSQNYERVMHYGLITQQAPFAMDYRVVYLSHSSPWQVEIKLMPEQVLHIGLCLPSACQSTEIKALTGDYLASSYMDNEVFELRPEVLYMKDLQLRHGFYDRPSFKLLAVAVLVTCAFMLCAQQLKVDKKLPPEGDDVDAGLAPVESEMWRALHSLLKWQPLQNFVSCYDVSSNWRKICAVRETKAQEIPLLNGVRSVCAIWLLVFHVFWFMYFTINNKAQLISYAEKFGFQYLSSAPLLVDVFFTISGFLQVYNFMRNTQQVDAVRQNGLLANAKLYGKLLFHRYLRIGPLYLIVIGSVDLAFAYIGDTSVYHIYDRFDELCAQHWWRNVFFIQNLFEHQEMCLNWSWSLACDMQFFLLANGVLFLYAKRPKLAKQVTISMLLASLVWSIGIGIKHNFEFSFDAFYATGSHIYTSSFVRVVPYIVGAIAAWRLHERKQQSKESNLSDRKERFYWHFSLVGFMICLFSTVKRDLGYLITILLFALGRVLFSMCICWMICRSSKGSGVWWSRLLEAPIFQHFNRLTYAIYLLNPLVISLVFSLTTASTHVDGFMMCVVACGFVMIVYLVSLVYSMAFELPYSNLSSLLMKRNSNNSKPKTT